MSMYRQSIIRIFVKALILATCATYFSSVFANEKSDLARLDEILSLSDRDNQKGLKQLEDFKKELSADSSDVVRLTTLKNLVGLYYDAGQSQSAHVSITEFLQLAERLQNKDALALGKIFDSFRILNSGKPELALEKLMQVKASVKDSKDPEVNMRLNEAFGRVYNVAGKFELSLTHNLEALRFADLQRRRIQAKMYMLGVIAELYTWMKDPEKALATTKEALLLSPSSSEPKILASLANTQGLAYALLGKNNNAIDAFQRSLKFGIDAKMPGVEALALVNIGYHYLLVHDYIKAEKFSRLALPKVEAINNKTHTAIAKINIGLALGGQGKINQGVVYINEVIQYFKDAGSKRDAETAVGALARMYENAGLYKEALLSLRQQQKLSEELFRSDRARAVAGLQEQFNAEQRQKQIELLGKENDLKDADIENRRLQQIITFWGALMTVMAGVFIFLMYRRVKKVNEQLKEANAQLELLAVRDPLTGLFNRRSFVDMMKSRVAKVEVERRKGTADDPACLTLMDIDHFKHINDTWGHAAGDSVLKEVARRFISTVRDTDMVLRWGGEEFLIHSPKSNPAQIAGLVDRLLRAIGEKAVEVGDLRIPVTVTAGFISLPFSGVPEWICDWEKILQIADTALYLGKANGRNRGYGLAKLLVSHEIAMPVLEHDLTAAISAGMVELIVVIGPTQLKSVMPEASSGQ